MPCQYNKWQPSQQNLHLLVPPIRHRFRGSVAQLGIRRIVSVSHSLVSTLHGEGGIRTFAAIGSGLRDHQSEPAWEAYHNSPRCLTLSAQVQDVA